MVNTLPQSTSEASLVTNGPVRGSPTAAADKALRRNGMVVSLPVIRDVGLPSAPHLAWYAGVAALTLIEVIEWPVAFVVVVGKALADNHHSAVLKEFGDALESEA
jgi:hypothetical protein